MTISYKGGVIWKPRTIDNQRKLRFEKPWGGGTAETKRGVKIEMIPGDVSDTDLVRITDAGSLRILVQNFKGPAIKSSTECRKHGIGWYK